MDESLEGLQHVEHLIDGQSIPVHQCERGLQHPQQVGPEADAGRSVPRIGLGPNLLRMLESTLALVDGYGLTVDQMLDVLETLQAFVHGYVLDEVTEQEAQRRTGLTMSEAQQQHESHVRRIMESGHYPQFARVVTESADDLDPHMVFE